MSFGGDDSPFGASGEESPFGASDTDTSPFGSTGNDSPFGANGDDPNPFGASNNNDPFGAAAPAPEAAHVVANPFGAAQAPAPEDPFAIGNDAGQPPAHVVPNPFGAAPAHVVPNPFGAAPPANDPFAIGNDAEAAHVVPNPFGAAAANDPFAFGGAQAQQDPFAIGNDAEEAAPAHVVPNPFGAAAPPADPFAFGGAQAQQNPFAPAADAGHVVDNPFGGGFGAGLNFGAVANPFGIANDGPAGGDDLDISQHSIGGTFLAGHMIRLSEQSSMLLSEEERRWTTELKRAVEASKDISKMSDMEIAQQALTNRGNVYNALLSIKAQQEFVKTYEIDDTPQQGLECLRALLDQQEGFVLDIDCNDQTQESAVVVDLRQFQPSKALALVEGKNADHSWQVLVRGCYYLNRATQPSLSSIRHGLFLCVDCDGVGWENFNHEVDQRMHAELVQHMPLKWKKVMAYSTAMVANVWWGLTKRLWSSDFRSVLETGCRLVDTDPSRPPRRLAEMYRQPDLATVQRKVERRAAELLDTRDANEQEFTLQQDNVAATATS